MRIIRRLVATGEHIGHATEEEARAFFAAKKAGGDVGTVVTPDGQEVTLHGEVTDDHVEDAVQAHTEDTGQDYTGTPKEGESGWKKEGDNWVRDPSAASAAPVQEEPVAASSGDVQQETPVQ